MKEKLIEFYWEWVESTLSDKEYVEQLGITRQELHIITDAAMRLLEINEQ